MELNKDAILFAKLLSACVFDNGKIAEQVDWDFIFAHAVKNDVLSILLPAFRDNKSVKEENIALVEKRSTADAYRETKKFACASRFLNALRQNGITAVVLKGLAYKRLYPYPELRKMSDLDLLVLDGDLNRVYEIAQSVGGVTGDEVHHFTIDSTLNVETTVLLYPDNEKSLFDEYLINDEITADCICEFDYYNDRFYTLTPTHNLLYCAYHMFKHFVFGGIGARQMCDFALLISKFSDEIDWKYIFEQSERAHMTRFVVALIRIAESYFGVDASGTYQACGVSVGDDVVGELWCDMIEGGVFGVSTHEREVARSIVFRRLKGGNNGGEYTGVRSAFPPLSYMRNEFSYVNSLPVLLPIGWIHRLGRFIFKRIFKRGELRIVSKVRKTVDKRLKIMDKLDI